MMGRLNQNQRQLFYSFHLEEGGKRGQAKVRLAL
jgi:hypothetical protein